MNLEFRRDTMSSTNPPNDDDKEKPDPLSLTWYFGESELSALLLAMVMNHCAGYAWEDEQAGLTSYLYPPHRDEDYLNSYGDPNNADAMTALAQDGLIEITHQDGPRIWAKVTPEGHAYLARLRIEQERRAASSWKHP